MTNFFKNKWTAFLSILVCAIITAVFVGKIFRSGIEEFSPAFLEEAKVFMPITVENGEIVAPQDTIISKNYAQGDNVSFNVVLDTRVDEFELSSLKDAGIYSSRKYLYINNGRKVEVASYEKLPNVTINEETLQKGIEYVKKNLGKGFFFVLLITYALFAALAVALYTLVMHWIMAKLFNVKFGYTYTVNAFVYAILNIGSLLGGFGVSIWLTLAVMLIVNYALNSYEKKTLATA